MFEAVTKSGDALIVHNTLPPVGTILFIAGNTMPENCVPAVGEELNRTAYAELFGVTGTLYGEGDGSTTFNAPDMRGRFPEGAQTAGGYNTAGLPNIWGAVLLTAGGGTGGIINATYECFSNEEQSQGFDVTLSNVNRYKKLVFDASRSSSVYGASPTVQPASVKLLPVIVYRSKRTVINSGGGIV